MSEWSLSCVLLADGHHGLAESVRVRGRRFVKSWNDLVAGIAAKTAQVANAG